MLAAGIRRKVGNRAEKGFALCRADIRNCIRRAVLYLFIKVRNLFLIQLSVKVNVKGAPAVKSNLLLAVQYSVYIKIKFLCCKVRADGNILCDLALNSVAAPRSAVIV